VRAQKEAAKRQLPQKVEVVEIPQDDCWFRDSGCTVRGLRLLPPMVGILRACPVTPLRSKAQKEADFRLQYAAAPAPWQR